MGNKPKLTDETPLIRAVDRYRKQLCDLDSNLEERLITGKMERLSFSEIVQDFDLILFDAYGVLNRPTVPVVGAIEVIQRLEREGIPYLIVSNNASDAPWRITQKLQKMGFEIPVEKIVTSGMAVNPFIEKSPYQGKPYLLVGTSDSLSDYAPDPTRLLVNPLDGPVRQALQPAYVLVCSNMHYYGTPQQTVVESWLAEVGGLPYLLANPDMIVETDHRVPSVVAGYTVDQFLLRFGGELLGIGKPYPAIYDLALARYPTLPRQRILMVGDSLSTDILGGAGMGFATCLTLSGLHGYQADEIESVSRQWAICPDFIVPSIAH